MEHWIGNKRIIRLIRKWLQAGILEDGAVTVSERGTGQGSVASPLLEAKEIIEIARIIYLAKKEL